MNTSALSSTGSTTVASACCWVRRVGRLYHRVQSPNRFDVTECNLFHFAVPHWILLVGFLGLLAWLGRCWANIPRNPLVDGPHIEISELCTLNFIQKESEVEVGFPACLCRRTISRNSPGDATPNRLAYLSIPQRPK